MKIAIISFNSKGNIIAKTLKESIGADLFIKDKVENFNLKELVESLMKSYNALIFISSTGIAVRAIAPYLKSKTEDPAVLVIDILGNYVISLLSGHIGGANELTIKVAKIINAEPIITTATDGMGIEAPDMIAKRNNLVIGDIKACKDISALLVDGKKVAFIDEENKIKLPKGYCDNIEDSRGLVYITNKDIKDYKGLDVTDNDIEDFKGLGYATNRDIEASKGLVNFINKDESTLEDIKVSKDIKTLYLLRKSIILGIGCKKNYSVEIMKETVLGVLKKYNLDYRSVKAVVTIELKGEEQAIIELAKSLQAEFKIFSKEEIKEVHNNYKGSNFVEKSIGVRAVCEPCVELYGARLIREKLNCNGMTICIGKIDSLE